MGHAQGCTACRAPLPIDAAFCPHCGTVRPPDPSRTIAHRLALRCRRWGRSVVRAATARQAQFCPSCRLLLPADAAFCLRCGAGLSLPGATPAAGAATWTGAGDWPGAWSGASRHGGSSGNGGDGGCHEGDWDGGG